jgi:hypothetical protein
MLNERQGQRQYSLKNVAHITYLELLDALNIHNNSDVGVFGSPCLLEHSSNLVAVLPLRTLTAIGTIHHQDVSSPIDL